MDNPKNTFTIRTVIQMLVFIVLVPLLPLLISWEWDWWQAWVYAMIGIFGFAVSRILVARRHPDLLAERSKFMQHENIKPWDSVLARLVSLGGGLIPTVAGLEARYDWPGTDFGLSEELIAMALILLGYTFGAWALTENRFFSGVVRIQKERGHHVVSTGPYAWIRHPGYAGALLTYLVTPILLDSLWTFLPVALISIVLLIRTDLEDRALKQELPGYRNYAQKTRYRLLPGVW